MSFVLQQSQGAVKCRERLGGLLRGTITATRRERIIMFKRLKTWLVVCAERYQ